MAEIKTHYKKIEFYQDGEDDKTWFCCNHHRGGSGEDLGRVVWDADMWKCWVWQQDPEVKFSISCIDDLGHFMKQLKAVE